MITKDESGKDLVKVVDFGIARFEQEAQRLTRMGEVWGSPIYMSPEQCMGAQLDTRSDIYSLGVVMYEAITARV
ncbi:protein kinase, partial [Acinetobacter baumannii]